MFSVFPAYGISFGKKKTLYVLCQHCPPKKINCQRKNILCSDNDGKKSKVLPQYSLFF